MKLASILLLTICVALTGSLSVAQQMTIAAASSLRPALDRVVDAYKSENPRHDIAIIYGASGRLTAQILNGAPFDFFMSADMDFPRRLAEEGSAATVPEVYAKGRIVLWSFNVDASAMTLQDLGAEHIARVAIAQPNVAPYGQRAREAMQAVGVWDAVADKLVFGENISQVAQMAQSGAADVGIIALSLVMQPELATRGYALVDAALHQPLEQGYVITRRGADNAVAGRFAQFLSTPAAQTVFRNNGFDVDD